MSAWMITKSHVATMVQFCERDAPREFRDRTLADVCNELLRECARSVDFRYQQSTETDALEQFADDAEVLQFAVDRYMEAGAVLKLCHCYDYQACETETYRESQAHRYVRAIEAHACRRVKGYDDAPWGVDNERSNVVSLSSLLRRAGQ